METLTSETSNEASTLSELLSGEGLTSATIPLIRPSTTEEVSDEVKPSSESPALVELTGSDASNLIHSRNVHIPYILNGELYQIQTQDGENVTVKCCHCPPDRVYRGSVRSTGNFHMHIKRRHPDLLGKLHDMKVSALLERRDRLMRNRKAPHRGNRNRQTASGLKVEPPSIQGQSEQQQQQRQHPASTSSELDLMQTHKLKIKAVFQRHQLQQRAAAALSNWSGNPFVVLPNARLPTTTDDSNQPEPINYSLRTGSNHEVERAEMERPLSSGNINVLQDPQSAASVTSQTTVSSMETSHNNITTTPTPTVLSSYSSSHHCRGSHALKTISVVKNEHLMLSEQAIDLSMQTDSGVFSGIDSTTFGCDGNDSFVHDSNSDSAHGPSSSKWQELLVQVETSLRDIQREMNNRNQIETNRLFLDIAKFKYLHPGFHFHW